MNKVVISMYLEGPSSTWHLSKLLKDCGILNFHMFARMTVSQNQGAQDTCHV